MKLHQSVKSAAGTGITKTLLSAAPIIPALFAVAIIAWLPPSISGGQAKSPPPGAPTVEDPRAYKGLTPEQIERMEAGEVVILKSPEHLIGRQMVLAAFILDRDIDTVWELMASPWRQGEYLANVESATLIKKWDIYDQVEIKVRIMGIPINYCLIGTRDKSEYYSHWELNPEYKNDMKEVTGFYRFYWIDENHTLARYGTLVETKVFLPPAVQTFMTKQALPQSLGAVKKWLDSGGEYRREGDKKPGP